MRICTNRKTDNLHAKRRIPFVDLSYGDAWYLELLVVDQNCKGQGLGEKMLNDCIKPYVRQHGGDTVTLITNTERNCRFYEKNGFMQFAKSELRWENQSVNNWSYISAI